MDAILIYYGRSQIFELQPHFQRSLPLRTTQHRITQTYISIPSGTRTHSPNAGAVQKQTTTVWFDTITSQHKQ